MSTPIHQTPINPKEAADILRHVADRIESGDFVLVEVAAGHQAHPMRYSTLTLNYRTVQP